MGVVCNRQITTAQRNYQCYYRLRMHVALTSLTSTLNIALGRKISFLFDFLFNIYGCFFNNYDLRSSDVKKRQIWHQNLLSYILMVSIRFMRFSNERMVQ